MTSRTACWLLIVLGFPPAFGPDAASYSAEAWSEADQLFHQDPHWAGADDAYSIDFGKGKVVWLFADTWIDPTGEGSRKSPGATIVGNSVGIQQGYDPSRATMKFFWRAGEKGAPAPFFPDDGKQRHWPGDGVRIRDRLVVFFMKVKLVPRGLGFEMDDWEAVLIRNPDEDPMKWELSWLKSPPNRLRVIVGSGAVLARDGFVYAFGMRDGKPGETYLVRWTEDAVYAGDLSGMEWAGVDGEWVRGMSPEKGPVLVMKDGASEFTVHFDIEREEFVQIQTVGFGQAELAIRTAKSLTGPWPKSITMFRPEEYDKPDIMIYSGKAHTELSGADLVLTYCTNSFDFEKNVNDQSIYYPRFVALTRDRSE